MMIERCRCMTGPAFRRGETGGERAAYIEPVGVGDKLPEMPLFLSNTLHVLVPLEWPNRPRLGKADVPTASSITGNGHASRCQPRSLQLGEADHVHTQMLGRHIDLQTDRLAGRLQRGDRRRAQKPDVVKYSLDVCFRLLTGCTALTGVLQCFEELVVILCFCAA
jgi:hypothetical protein